MNLNDLDISSLSPAECAALADRLWERAYQHQEEIPVPPAHMAELERRLEAFDRGELPPAEPWEDVDAWLDTL